MKRGTPYVLSMSAELQARMRAAAAVADVREGVTVLFDGSRDRPWGMYLAAESEAEYTARQKPLRHHRDLTPDEVSDLLQDVYDRRPIEDVALRFHMHPDSVEYIVTAVACGILQPA